MTIREVKEDDAVALLALMRLLDRETAFMLYEPDERQTTVAQQLAFIRRLRETPNRTLFVAVNEAGDLVGYVAALGGSARRNAHKADVVIGVAQEFAGCGLGTRLMMRIEVWARTIGLHKLELTVMAHNGRAVALYRKMGFVDEGRQVDSLQVDGRFVDELTLGKILTEPGEKDGSGKLA